jgi:hypothetical protein
MLLKPSREDRVRRRLVVKCAPLPSAGRSGLTNVDWAGAPSAVESCEWLVQVEIAAIVDEIYAWSAEGFFGRERMNFVAEQFADDALGESPFL